MKYKGYTAKVEFDERDGLLVGHVLHLQNAVSFEGASVAEVRAAFEEAVDDYLDWCEEEGKQPDKMYSGNIPARLTPEQHREITEIAAREGVSINTWIANTLQSAVDRDKVVGEQMRVGSEWFRSKIFSLIIQHPNHQPLSKTASPISIHQEPKQAALEFQTKLDLTHSGKKYVN